MKLVLAFVTYNNLTFKYLDHFLPSLKLALDFLPRSDYQIMAWDNSNINNQNNRLAVENFNRLQGNLIDYQSQGVNLGFGAAYNVLLQRAVALKAKYFLIINPDTLLSPLSLKELLAAMEQDASLASVAPKMFQWDFGRNFKTTIIDSAGMIMKPGLKFIDLAQGEKDKHQLGRAKIIGPSGAAGLFRLSALEKVKNGDQYFDERFFMYKEDCDLNYRLYLAGFSSRLVSAATIYHDRSVSVIGTGFWSSLMNRNKKSRQVRVWSFLGQHLLFIKHWRKQNSSNKLRIVLRVLSIFIFSLIFERFLLKHYKKLGTFF